jgi:hypothetical protein
MPPDTIAINPQTGKRIKWDGQAWVPLPDAQPPGALDRYRTSLRGGMGLKPEGGPVDDIKQIGSGLKQEFSHPIDSAKLLLEALMNSQQEVFNKGQERVKKPGVMNKVEGAAQLAESGLPGVGPILSQAGEEFEKKDVAGGLGTMTPLLAGQASETPMGRSAALKGADIATAPIRKTGDAVHDYLGGDERELARAHEEHVSEMEKINRNNIETENTLSAEWSQKKKQAEIEAEGATLQEQATHKLKVDQLNEEYSGKLAKQAQDYKDKVKTAAREHEDRVKGLGGKVESTPPDPTKIHAKENFNARQGPAWQRVKGMTDQIASQIDPLEERVRKAHDARWGAWRIGMGADTTGDFTPVMKAVEEAQRSLEGQPENIKIFNDILKEGEDPLLGSASVFRGGGSGIDVKDLTGSRYMSEATRNRVLQSLRDAGISEESGRAPIQQTTLPIGDLVEWNRDLQKKLYGKYDPKIYKAVKMVQKAAEDEVGRVAKDKGQFEYWTKLKKDYSQKLDDFDNTDGPLYKLRYAPNTEQRLNLLTGAEADRIIDALGRYDKYVARDAQGQSTMNAAGKLRSVVHQIEELGKPQRSIPKYERPERPERPEAPEIPYPLAPRQAKVPPKPEFTPKEVTPFNPEDFRREHFMKVVKKFKTFGFDDKGAIVAAVAELAHGNLPLALTYPVVKRILGSVMDRPSVEAWVTKERAKYQ